MLFELKNYQRDAVDELKNLINFKLNSNSSKEIVLKAPTGSGKTFIISCLFEELVEENKEDNFCIMWACPGKGELHKQSYNAVKNYTGGNPICSLLEDDFFGSRQYIKKHEIVFVNWEKLIDKDRETGKWKNNLMKDQEGANFVDVLDVTRENNTKLILVIDESHIGKNAETRIQEFKNDIINPDLVLEMSATPINKPDYIIDPEDVIAEGMIKNNVIVNEGINRDKQLLNDKDSETIILEKGYEKRLELLNEFESVGANVNPLVLIQIPNVEAGEDKKLIIKDYLREKDINEENGKLKLWCDNKANFDKKAISNNNDITEFLVFKTAVATGWDCPRAHILIKFREGKSEIFEIQTIGRILRTPEAKSYDNELLDNAYIYTNSLKFETKAETYNPNKIKTLVSNLDIDRYSLDEIYNHTQLISYYRSRQGNYNSATTDFNSYFLDEFMFYFNLKDKDKYLYDCCEKIFKKAGLNLDVNAYDEMIEERNVETKDINEYREYKTDYVNVKASANDIKAQYYNIIEMNLNGLASARSKGPISSAIVNALSTFYDIFPRSNKIDYFQRIVVNNKNHFGLILNKATFKYRNDLLEKSGMKGITDDYRFVDKRFYSEETHRNIGAVKSIYQPLYVLITGRFEEEDKINALEEEFITYLDLNENVDWYFENGQEPVITNFGISYNNGINTFQPDFIIKFNNGDVGIFDTKPIGYRTDDTKLKAEVLYKYCLEMNKRKNRPRVIGGMVVKKGNNFYYYLEEEYHDFNESTNNWKLFDELGK